MNAPAEIAKAWHHFDAYPMETLTKAWFLKQNKNTSQRSVDEMIRHRTRYGASGNCFDLALWLVHKLREVGTQAYYVGHNLGTGEAHVAVIALDAAGQRWLCDLGDLWVQPLNLEARVIEQEALFPAAKVTAAVSINKVQIEYLRSNGKKSYQEYDLTKVTDEQFLEAARICQRSLSRPLVEMRISAFDEVTHWEFDHSKSFLSTKAGLMTEPELKSNKEWAQRIAERTGIKADYALACLEAFEELHLEG